MIRDCEPEAHNTSPDQKTSRRRGARCSAASDPSAPRLFKISFSFYYLRNSQFLGSIRKYFRSPDWGQSKALAWLYVIERLSSMTCIQLRFLRRDLLWSYQGGGTPRRVASSCRPLPHIEFSSKNLSMFKVESRRHMANWHCLIFRQTYWLMEAKTQSSFLSLILAIIFIVLILKNKFIYVSSESWSFARMLDEGEIVKIDNGKKKKSN